MKSSSLFLCPKITQKFTHVVSRQYNRYVMDVMKHSLCIFVQIRHYATSIIEMTVSLRGFTTQ